MCGDLMLRYAVQSCLGERVVRRIRRGVADAYKLVSRLGQ